LEKSNTHCKLIFQTAENFGLNMVTRKELSTNNEKYDILQFGSEESIVISKPYNRSDEIPRLIKSKIGTFTLENLLYLKLQMLSFGSTVVDLMKMET